MKSRLRILILLLLHLQSVGNENEIEIKEFCLIIIFSKFLLDYLQNAVVFKLTNAVCESYNKTWLEFHLCRLKAVNRDKVYLNLNVTLHYSVNDVFIKGQLMKRANGYKPWLYSVTFNGCEFIRRRNNPLIKLVWELFKEYSTLNHTCPYVVSP